MPVVRRHCRQKKLLKNEANCRRKRMKSWPSSGARSWQRRNDVAAVTMIRWEVKECRD